MTFANQTLNEFFENVAARTVTPSGGAVAAVGGASGAALCEMVCIHTIEKDDYADVRTEFTAIRNELETRRVRLLELADEDSMAVEELQSAFGTSKDDGRAELIQEKSRQAAEVPLEIAESCLDILEHATVVTANGNTNALADAGTGVFLAHSALQASVFTVRTNLEIIEEPTTTTRLEEQLSDLDEKSKEALSQVKSNLEQIK